MFINVNSKLHSKPSLTLSCFARTSVCISTKYTVQYIEFHENVFQYLDTAHTGTGIILAFVCYITHKPVLPKSKCCLNPKLRYSSNYHCKNLLLLTPLSLDILTMWTTFQRNLFPFRHASFITTIESARIYTKFIVKGRTNLNAKPVADWMPWKYERVRYILLWRRKQKDKDRETETEKLPRTELQGRFRLWLSLCAVQRNWSWKQTEIMFSVTCSAPLHDPKK